MLGVFSRAGFVRGRLSGCRFLATISTSTTTGTAIIPSSGSSSTRRWGRTGAVSWINPRLQPGEDRRVMSRIPARPASSPPSTAPPASPSGDPGWRPPPWRRTSSAASTACPAACSENPELVFDGFRQQVLTCPRPLRIGGVRLPDRLLRHSRGLVASARRSRRPRARRLGDKSQRTHLTSPKRSRPPGGSAGLRTLLRAPAIRCGPASRSPTTGWSWMSRLPRRSIRSLRAARRPACIDRTKHRRSKTSPACPVSARRTSP